MDSNPLTFLDVFGMAFKLLNRVDGMEVSLFDPKYRLALREIAEGRLTLVDEQILQRAKGMPFLEQLIAEERKRAALLLEGFEVVEQ